MHIQKPLSKFLALLMVICMSMQLLWIPAAAVGETDYSGHWAQSSIEKLLQNSIIGGDENGKINPNGNMTRAEFVKIVNKTFGYTAMSDSNYPDVQSDAWYANEFRIAKQAGYIQGDQNGNANPKDPITKDEVCAILARALGIGATTAAKLSFSDESAIESWAYEGVKYLFDLGLITGNPDNTFTGKNKITRAECFTILAKIIDKGLNKAEAPYASVAPGTYSSNQTVELKSKTNGATVYYTTDDTTPTANSTKYTSAIEVNKTMNIKTIAVKAGLQTSAVAVLAYTIYSGFSGGNVTPPVPPASITREQWIVALMNKLGMSITVDQLQKDESGNPIYTFADTASSANALTIEAAVFYRALTVDTSETTHYMHPSDPCTREFAAVTAVRALGFLDTNGTLECSDVADLKYQSLDAIAVKVELISLINGKFMPASNLTAAEEASILDRALKILTPPEISENKTEFEYSADLVQLTTEQIGEYTITVEGSTYTVIVPKNDSTKGLKADDVFTIPKGDEYPDGLALKISSVTENEDGTLTLKCILPEVSEVLDSMNIEGTGTGDFSNFEPSDEIEIVEEFPEETIVENSANVTLMAESSKPKVKFKVNTADGTAEAQIKAPIDGGPISAFAKIKFDMPTVDYKADVDWLGLNIKDLYFAIHEKTTIEGGVEFGGKPHALVSKSFKLGKLPVVVNGVRVASINIMLRFDATGRWNIECALDQRFGVQIVNNQPKSVFEIHPSVSMKVIEGELKFGPDLKVMLETKVPFIENPVNIADVDLFAAIGVKGSLLVRDTGMTCMDGYGYMPVELSAGMDEDANTFLHQIFEKFNIRCAWQICDKDFTPWYMPLHAEDGKIVPECTFKDEQGQITGMVLQALDRHTAIPDADVNIYNNKNKLVKSIKSGDEGSFICSLDVGSYSVWVSAPGYKSFGSVVSIAAGEDTYLESFLMVNKPDDPNAAGVSGGNITDSLTGSAISDVKITVRDNWNNTIGEAIYTYTTGSNGKYEVTLPVGNYTVLFEKEGYVTNHVNIVVQTNPDMNQHVTLNPTSTPSINGSIRMVLTWGTTPTDLDSHLLGPTADGSDRFHIFFGAKDYTNGGTKIANLDLDDTNSYGPETTTVYELNDSGTYSFYVHDFTNRTNNPSSKLSQSGAQVKVYSGDTLIAVYNVPTNAEGTLWHVFDFDAATNSIKVSNGMSYTSAAGDVGKRSIQYTVEDTDKSIIEGSLTDKATAKQPTDEQPTDTKKPDAQTTDIKTPDTQEQDTVE